jgi:FkbM family methyltransferase
MTNTPVGCGGPSKGGILTNEQGKWGGGVNSSGQAKHFMEKFPNRKLDVVIDIGANSGTVGFYLLTQGAAKHCVFVEPLLEERLREKAAEQHVENRCVIIPKVVARKSGLIYRFRAMSDGQASFMFKEGGPWWGTEECEVESISFVELLRHYDRIDFLKIDIEGGEWNFLAPDKDILKQLKKVGYMDLEIHVGGNDYEETIKGLDLEFFHPYYQKRIKTGMNRGDIRALMVDWLVDAGFQRPEADNLQKQGKEFSFARAKW